MTIEELRKEFCSLHPGKAPLMLSNAVYGKAYGEWMEATIIKINNILDVFDVTCCPKCGSKDTITTIYCNNCNEAM